MHLVKIRFNIHCGCARIDLVRLSQQLTETSARCGLQFVPFIFSSHDGCEALDEVAHPVVAEAIGEQPDPVLGEEGQIGGSYWKIQGVRARI